MEYRRDRRDFLRLCGAATAAASLGGLALKARADEPKGCPNAEKLGWHLGCQAYSFNHFTFFEACDKNASMGLKWLEAYPGQKISAEKPDARFEQGMSGEIRDLVKKKLADCGITLVNFGVTGLPADEAAARKTFEFAKDMGIRTIVSEPAADAFDTVEKLADEFGINVALHNHPEPSPYWNPDKVLAVCKGRSKRIGSCADTGHWMRSGVNPLDAIKKLEGRIISFHFKDLDRFGHNAHDVVWGTGKANVKELLAEVHRQKFQGVFSIEFEYNWGKSMPELVQSVAFFDKCAAELGG
jgi:sugar phosphate isomerase/epimerase